MKILGRGAYGKVYLVYYKNDKEYYTMKSLKIENIDDDQQIYQCIENKKIQNLDFPFLIDVSLCFITDDRVYFIMEFVHGEDLLTSIRLNEEKFDESQVKFYAVVLGLSLQYLHQNEIILKDLHLDNIIIDKDGYLKLINFKLGQLFNMKEESILMKETSEFLSPEVISSNSCRKVNDWWSYGIILYQLLFGIPPFYSNDDNEIRQQILNNELRFPKDNDISESAKDLLKLLLKKNPEERLGVSNGFDEIRNHKFFEGINFDDIINKKYEPDYKPEVINILKARENNVEFTYEDLINSKIKEENKLNEFKNELVFATKLLKENPDGIIVATMLVAKYRDEVYILMDGYNKDFKNINAKHLMTWKLIEKYSKEKYKRFNLGGMTNPTLNNAKYNGLNEFKLSFNARCVEYVGDLELITNSTMYNLYRNSKPIRYILKKDK